jgi:F0F1-type ATP synthase delta subunit
MKYKPAQYAEALAASLDGASASEMHTRVRAFAELLKKHRMLGKAEGIMRIVERRLAKRAGATRVTFETADTPSESLRKEVTGIFGGKAWIEEKVRPELLAGIRILVDDETLVDASGKRRLAEIFAHTA